MRCLDVVENLNLDVAVEAQSVWNMSSAGTVTG
jgi:hypothetical protein